MEICDQGSNSCFDLAFDLYSFGIFLLPCLFSNGSEDQVRSDSLWVAYISLLGVGQGAVTCMYNWKVY